MARSFRILDETVVNVLGGVVALSEDGRIFWRWSSEIVEFDLKGDDDTMAADMTATNWSEDGFDVRKSGHV